MARVLLFLFFVLLVLEMVLAWQFGSARTVVPPDAAVAAPPRRFLARVFDLRNAADFPLLLAALVGAVLFHEWMTDDFLGFAPPSWRAGLEHVLGVPQAAPGEGTRWKLEYLSYLTGYPTADRWLVFALRSRPGHGDGRPPPRADGRPVQVAMPTGLPPVAPDRNARRGQFC